MLPSPPCLVERVEDEGATLFKVAPLWPVPFGERRGPGFDWGRINAREWNAAVRKWRRT